MKRFKLVCILLVMCLISFVSCSLSNINEEKVAEAEKEGNNSYKLTIGYTSYCTVAHFNCDNISFIDGVVTYTVSDDNISEVIVTNGTAIVKYKDSSIETYSGNVKVVRD